MNNFTLVIDGRNFEAHYSPNGKPILYAVDQKPITDDEFKKFEIYMNSKGEKNE